jgi:hypothetical protein
MEATKSQHQHLETLTEIKDIMERSSRFLSLSGLSGILAGLFALLGATAAYFYFEMELFAKNYYSIAFSEYGLNPDFMLFFFLDGLLVLALSVFFATLLSYRKAQKRGLKIRTKATRLMVINMMIPLVVGGVFIFALAYHQLIYLIAPATLVFYGLALINASKYTFSDIRYLGICEILLGLIATFAIGYGLLIWSIGFGFLHIFYGATIWYKYDRVAKA